MTAPDETVKPPKRRSRGLLVGLLAVPVLLAGVGASLWWGLGSEPGTEWLLRQVPGLQIEAPQGRLIGDFSARRITFKIGGTSLELNEVQWRGLSVAWSSSARLWADVSIDSLHAERVQVLLEKSTEPSRAPTSLALPLGLRIGSLSVTALSLPTLSEQPVTALQASVALSDELGQSHRIKIEQARWDLLSLSGTLGIQTAGKLRLKAALALASAAAETKAGAALPPWAAQVQLDGPLAALDLKAELSAQAQKLQAQARLLPFAAWPLSQLLASTDQLDLAALVSGAPHTALSGQLELSASSAQAPIRIKAAFSNPRAGRWDEQALPLRSLALDLSFSPTDPAALQIEALDLLLGSAKSPAGRVHALGKSAKASGSELSIALDGLRSEGLDARLSPLRASGRVLLSTARPANQLTAKDLPPLQVRARLGGKLRVGQKDTPLDLQAQALIGAAALQLQSFKLTADGAAVEASGDIALKQAGSLAQGWSASAQASAQVLDLRRFWRGAEGSAWQRTPQRVDAVLSAKLQAGAAAVSGRRPSWLQQAPLGTLRLQVAPTSLAGVPLSADLQYAYSGQKELPRLRAELLAGVNKLQANLLLSGKDQLDAELDLRAENLAALQPLLAAHGSGARLQGSLVGKAGLQAKPSDKEGWSWHSEADLQVKSLRLDQPGGTTQLSAASARWSLDSGLDAPLLAQLNLQQFSSKGVRLPTATAALQGKWAKHQLQLQAQLESPLPAALIPPGQPKDQIARGPVTLSLSGALSATPAQAWRAGAQWQFSDLKLLARSQDSAVQGPAPAPWLQAQGLAGVLALAPLGQPLQARVNPGRLELLGAGLRWQQFSWARSELGGADRFDLDLQLDPLSVAPLLARWQPDFGWGGSLVMSGSAKISTWPSPRLELALERSGGDLSVTDDSGTQALGLSELRLGVEGSPGVWHLTQALAGSNVGVLGGALTARNADASVLWPGADSRLEGVLEARVANLSTWGAWVPAGWRLAGNVFASASFAGRLDAPEVSGRAGGAELSLRNPLLGVDVRGGEFALKLNGSSAELEQLKARSGDGELNASGTLKMGAAPHADLRISAQKFAVLRRVDRRIAMSGEMRLLLDPQALDLQGKLSVDEGLFDFSRGNAPQLDDDVDVVRPTDVVAVAQEKAAAKRVVKVKLDIALGRQLRVRGRGLDTLLGGELQLTHNAGGPVLNGRINTEGGTFDAYGQKLDIERGQITFAGVLDNPRLDVLAIRPSNEDVRVGVTITGTALSPRIKLFSEPEMSDSDKLSWLLLGRAPDGLGRADTALLQRAAMALISGQGESSTGKLIKSFGLDELSVGESGSDARGTVVRLGKQISRRWYVGYERGLNATTGSWQLIYRIAQRFTLRAQSGDENALDLIWQWKWE